MATNPAVPQAGPASGPIRILIVDEHARVRHSLGIYLSTCPGLDVVAEAGDGGEALRCYTETRPTVVLMDLAAPGMDSPVVTRRMKELNPESHIIALTSYADPEIEARVLDAGALCCLVKDSRTSALVEAIRRAHAGGPPSPG